MSTHIQTMPDLTESDGDTEDRGQLEERVVDNDIYESVDVVPGPQEDMRDNTAGRQTQGEFDKVVNRCQGDFSFKV